MYAIAKIIGDGSGENPYRANVDKDHKMMKLSNPNGSLKHSWTLITCPDIDNATGTGLFKIPTIGLDEEINVIPILARTGMLNELVGKGIDTTQITDQSRMRDVIKLIGKHINGVFDI